MNDEFNRAEVVLPIEFADSLVTARQTAKNFVHEFGVPAHQATLIAAVISELARNIIQFAGRGEIRLRHDADRMLYVIASDEGPGIADIRKALQPGYSTNGGLGLGLPGVQRVADQFRISSRPGATTVTIAMACAHEEPSVSTEQAQTPQSGTIQTDRRYAAKRVNPPAIVTYPDSVGDDCPDAPGQAVQGGEES